MNRYSVVLIFLLLTSSSVFAQRGGRADALQNYLGQNRNPRLLLQIKYAKKRLYYRLSDLQKKPRLTLTLLDSSSGQSHVYEGVSIEHLAPAGALSRESGTLEVSPEHKKKLNIICANVDFQTTPIVADRVDGKRLTGYVPYNLVVKARQGFSDSVQNVSLIEFKPPTDTH